MNQDTSFKLVEYKTSFQVKYFSYTSQICRQKAIDYVVAPYEADAQIAYLVKHCYADIAISEDSDLLTYGFQVVKND